jgi:hypothetical protein
MTTVFIPVRVSMTILGFEEPENGGYLLNKDSVSDH